VSYFGFQVYDMDEEVKRHRTTQDSLETELQALRQRLFRFENFTGTMVTTNESTEEYKSHISRSANLNPTQNISFSCISFLVKTNFGKNKCKIGRQGCKVRIVRYKSYRKKYQNKPKRCVILLECSAQFVHDIS